MHRRKAALVILAICLTPLGLFAAEVVKVSLEPAGIPYSIMAPIHRDRVRAVVDHPMVTAHGPAEAFQAPPEVYRWLLGHPKDAFRIWQSLGAKCTVPVVDEKGRATTRNRAEARLFGRRSPRERMLGFGCVKAKVAPRRFCRWSISKPWCLSILSRAKTPRATRRFATNTAFI